MTVILKKLSLFLLCLLIVGGPHRTLMTMSELCGTYQLFCRSLHSQEGATVPTHTVTPVEALEVCG